jgi:hypothetical protein
MLFRSLPQLNLAPSVSSGLVVAEVKAEPVSPRSDLRAVLQQQSQLQHFHQVSPANLTSGKAT